MELTVFPPFNITVAAVDALTQLGGHVRITLTPAGWSVRPGMPAADDAVYGCPGASIAVSPQALPLLLGATVSHGSGGFAVAEQPPLPLSA